MNLKNSTELRQKIVTEAETWLRTPFHHAARLKGIGTDCVMYLLEVYEAVDVIPHYEPEFYRPDWHLHQDAEKYWEGILNFAHEIQEPLPGDVALFQFGRVFSHGAIVIEWPRLIHAYVNLGVTYGDAGLFPLLNRDGTRRRTKFFSAIKN